MMLFKLSFKNITKSFKDYAIYFFTLILGVAIFYVFNAIESQTVMMNVSASTYAIIDLMNNMLSGVSVFVSFILGFLIIYASRFLIKRRNKEFGVYLTLGMSKRKVSLILFFETLFIGIISLVIGLGVGAILSQFMSILVANMFEADMTKFRFIFSTSACLKTLIYFGIIYVLVMIFNIVTISKCKLIDLLHGNKKSEKVKLKNPILCTIIFILSSIALGYAYYLVTGGVDKLSNAQSIFVPIVIGCVSTFFLFWSLSGLLLKIFMNMKKIYYKGLNSFTLRQISSKVNTTVFSMTIICIMLFITICVLSASLSIKNSMSKNINELAPIDIQLYKSSYKENNEYSNELIKEDSKVDIRKTLENNNIDVDNIFSDIVEINDYQLSDLTFKATLGSKYNEIYEKYPLMMYDNPERILTLSDYNKLAKLYGLEEYTLNNDEYMIVSDFASSMELRDVALKNKETITVNGSVLKPKYTECKNGFIDISSNHINDGVIIVPDDLMNDSMLAHYMLFANYNAATKEGKQVIEEKISEFSKTTWNQTSLTTNNTRIDIVEASIGLGALVTFIGLYLGIIFLLSSAAILALKELSESSDNKERFMMLRKIGTDEKMINRALFRQIAIFYFLPLLIAIIHSIFGIKFSAFILQTFGNSQLLPSIIMTAIFLIVIYGGYFLITYWCSKNIIKEK